MLKQIEISIILNIQLIQFSLNQIILKVNNNHILIKLTIVYLIQKQKLKQGGSRIYHLDLYIDQYSPINASSYIDWPKIIKNKKAVINVKNVNDNECFKCAILSALHKSDKDPQILSKY